MFYGVIVKVRSRHFRNILDSFKQRSYAVDKMHTALVEEAHSGTHAEQPRTHLLISCRRPTIWV